MKTLNHRRVAGVTLIELAFVIGIIAIIVVAALAIFNTVRASQDRSSALANVSSIRSAIAIWAGDKPLDINADTGLRNTRQLQPWLPGRLGSRTDPGRLVLESANPWDGDYEIQPADLGPTGGGADSGTGHPYRFRLLITDVPSAEAQALCRQLEDGATLAQDGSRRRIGFGSLDTGCIGSNAGEATTLEEIHIEYRV